MTQLKEQKKNEGHIILLNRWGYFMLKLCCHLLYFALMDIDGFCVPSHTELSHWECSIKLYSLCVISLSGHRLAKSPPNTYFYAATKFAVTAITEGIRRELREMNSNVKVTVRWLGHHMKVYIHFLCCLTEYIEDNCMLYFSL